MMTDHVMEEPQVGRGACVQRVAHFEDSIQGSASKRRAMLVVVAPRADHPSGYGQQHKIANKQRWLIDEKENGEVDQRQQCDESDGESVLGKTKQAIFSKKRKKRVCWRARYV